MIYFYVEENLTLEKEKAEQLGTLTGPLYNLNPVVSMIAHKSN